MADFTKIRNIFGICDGKGFDQFLRLREVEEEEGAGRRSSPRVGVNERV
jgi:hypothetical protein